MDAFRDNDLLQFLWSMLMQLPVLVVWLAGAAIAWSRREQYPFVARLVLAALAVMVGSTLLNTYANVRLAWWVQSLGLGADEFGLVMMGKGLITVSITAVAWGLILWAALGRRRADVG